MRTKRDRQWEVEKWWGTESKTKWKMLNPRGALQTTWYWGKELFLTSSTF